MHVTKQYEHTKAGEQDRMAKVVSDALKRPKKEDHLYLKVLEFQRKAKERQELVEQITREVLIKLGVHEI